MKRASFYGGARGFTLIELLVVIVIIGLLSAFVAPHYFSHIGRSKAQITRVQIEAFATALDQYRIDTGHYPSTEAGLAALVVRPANEPLWQGGYVKKGIPIDPWGNAYVYVIPGRAEREYDLVSYGADGKPDGNGEDADIASWN
jgi:general secretion pathway protein G